MLAGEPEGVADDDELSEHPDAISAVLKHRAVKIPMYFPIGREFLIFLLFFFSLIYHSDSLCSHQ